MKLVFESAPQGFRDNLMPRTEWVVTQLHALVTHFREFQVGRAGGFGCYHHQSVGTGCMVTLPLQPAISLMHRALDTGAVRRGSAAGRLPVLTYRHSSTLL